MAQAKQSQMSQVPAHHLSLAESAIDNTRPIKTYQDSSAVFYGGPSMAMEASLSKNRPNIPTHMSDESSPFILRTDHQNHEIGIGLEEPVKYTVTSGREPS